jgi:FAD/FMN-containing dehydrogenase
VKSDPTFADSKRRSVLKGFFLTGCAQVMGALPSWSMGSLGSSATPSDWEALADKIDGQVLPQSNSKFEIWRRTLVWQIRKPDRHPAAIVKAGSIDDVVATVHFAREQGYQIATRCGGHSYNAAFLQDSVIVLDIGKLRETTIDKSNKTARVQAAVRSIDLMALLDKEDLAFPAAHCGAVPMGGFLLGGGLGWNGEQWNAMSCFNIKEVEVVTADGDVIVANAKQNQDYFWAARGAGPCFFGIVTAFTLGLYDKPQSVITSTYTWPLAEADDAAQWASDMAAKLPANVESLFILTEAPKSLSQACAPDRKVGILQATAFSDSDAISRKLLEPLSAQPAALQSSCVSKDEYASTPIAALYEWDATAYPQWRWSVDCLWSDDSPGKMVNSIAEHISVMPSAKSSVLMLFKPRSSPLPEDAAFSVVGKTYLASYAIWGTPGGDEENIGWVDKVMTSLTSMTKAHYINESDYIAKPSRVRDSFSAQAWNRLVKLTKQYDPGQVFYRINA